MHVRTRDGVNLHVQQMGTRGTPIVMVHGISGNMMTWYWAAGRLAREHRVTLFDLRGHGLSERPAHGYGVGTMAEDLDAVIADVVREPTSLVGHSYGAMVALTYALRRPDLVRRLALVEAPYPLATRLAEMKALDGRPADVVADALLPAPLRDAVIVGGRRGRRFLEWGRALVEETTCFEDCRHSEDVPDAVLAGMRLPLLAVYGTSSSCKSYGGHLTKIVPGARNVELEGGHNLPSEATAPLTAELMRFFDA